MTDERKRSFLDWARESAFGHAVYIQLVWIVPLIVLVVLLRIIGIPRTMWQFVFFLLPILISGMFFVYRGWLRSGPRSSRKKDI